MKTWVCSKNNMQQSILLENLYFAPMQSRKAFRTVSSINTNPNLTETYHLKFGSNGLELENLCAKYRYWTNDG